MKTGFDHREHGGGGGHGEADDSECRSLLAGASGRKTDRSPTEGNEENEAP